MYKNNVKTRYSSLRQENNEEAPVIFEKLYVSIPLSIGVVLDKRIEFTGVYTPPVVIARYSGFGVNMQRYRLGVNYLFGGY